ncbi:Alpha-1,3-mannosyl-glycoprotein 4-beta-N-acetylglucosaminyltransferase B [Hondaea fermentalgiana]|uniref:Alpha-1,3-mannosyl-glycoprotein 4-beta-N-acetylglucosaminyltransferase B n=1 Tax=Hondaea fermentalgiana TaxID=2315210 RepID=A0A2R5GRU3_9STRA|nr:Alpha-1,3-mannosyl-glycoprotein 4-beta-N-acetylglucosaminyltransferase B [Hondaea fermentalgiana]|eukprot:GBG31363.1 Alpha-1,3-mannosyl-glycoprotein 4-beta-N-acetylglucosaminyltransferase B [Hondaea fermentalgiana]
MGAFDYFSTPADTRYNIPISKNGPSDQWFSGNGSWASRLLFRVLIFVVFAETLYIVSGLFANELLCDDLRLELHNARQDYERSQLVVKTLTLSCNESEYESCLRSVESTQQRFVQTQLSLGKRLDAMTHKIDTCKKEKRQLEIKLKQLPAPDALGAGQLQVGNANDERAVLTTKGLDSIVSADEGDDDNEQDLGNQLSFPSVPASPSTEADPRPWLVIGIPTVPRKDDMDYLGRTLKGLAAELPRLRTDPLFELVRVVVMNHSPGNHRAFTEARRYFGDAESPWAGYFDFVDNVDRITETPQEALKTQKDARRAVTRSGAKPGKPPSSKVQQQTRDVAQLLKYVHEQHRPAHYLFMEDDFVACPRMLDALRYAVGRVSETVGGDWLALRASFGLNGVVLQGDDLPALTAYLEKHQARREPDHLTSEWYLGETPEAQAYRKSRTHAAFRYNLFEHIGTVSTLRRGSHKQKFPVCWAPLTAPTIFAREAFNKVECPNADVWPCAPPPGQACDEEMLICDTELTSSAAVFAKP